MKKFQFRLQKVMEIKEEVEKQRMIDLGRAKSRVVEEERKLDELFKKESGCREQIEAKEAEDRINPAEMDLCFKYLRKLGRDIETQRDCIRDARTEMEARRQDLIAATKEKKILEKLRERKHFDYMINLARKEQFILDDLVSTFYAHGRFEQP